MNNLETSGKQTIKEQRWEFLEQIEYWLETMRSLRATMQRRGFSYVIVLTLYRKSKSYFHNQQSTR